MFKNIIENYIIRAGHTYIRTRGLSISQLLPCPQPSEGIAWVAIVLNIFKFTCTSYICLFRNVPFVETGGCYLPSR